MTQGSPFNGDIHLQDQFIKLKNEFGITHVIETGTYHGDTTKWLALNFNHVHTIESNMIHFQQAQKNLSGIPNRNVKMWVGDSSDRLSDMIEECEDEGAKLMIFLDAHWYQNPVIDELKQIASVGATPVLAIHDFKNPHDLTMGYDEYPDQKIVYEWSWIKPYVEQIYGSEGYEYFYNKEAAGSRRGCVFVIPKKDEKDSQ